MLHTVDKHCEKMRKLVQHLRYKLHQSHILEHLLNHLHLLFIVHRILLLNSDQRQGQKEKLFPFQI